MSVSATSEIQDMDVYGIIMLMYNDQYASNNSLNEPIFTNTSNTYSTITWDSNNNMTKPTEAQIITKYDSIKSDISLDVLKKERDILLKESDKYSLKDYPFRSISKRREWKNYRQSLRDITSQTPTINLSSFELGSITFPSIPSDESDSNPINHDSIIDGSLLLTDSDNSHYVGFKAATTISSDLTWTLPSTDGTSGQFLKTDGSGTLSWSNASSGGGAISSISNFSDNRIITASGSDTLNGEANLTFDGSTLNVVGTISCDTSLTIDSSVLDASDILHISDITAGTATASKALVIDSMKSISGITSLGTGMLYCPTISTSSNADLQLDPSNSGVVVFKGNSTRGSGQFKLNCENNSHGITIKGPAHSAAATYTLVLPTTDGGVDEVLKSDGSGNLSWATNYTTAFTGDSGSGGAIGLVPAPSSGDAAAGKYLKADGTWATVSGGGGGGISFDGSTANGMLTYKDSDEATVESNITFDGSTLAVGGSLTLNKAQGFGDVTIEFKQAGTTTYVMGIDDSSTNNVFKIHSSTSLVDNSDFTIDTSGNVTVGGDLILDDGGSIKEAGGTAAITIDSAGEVSKIGQDTPTDGQVLTWDNSNSKVVWSTVSGGGGGGLPSGVTYTGSGASAVFEVTGNIRATTDITAYHTSDRRYKENLKNIEEPNEKLKRINGYEFDWNEKHEVYKNTHDIGVIAQEIEEVLPEIVIEREDGYKAVRYEKIIPLLIESNKDLVQRVEGLEQTIKEKDEKYEKLEKRMKKLEELLL